MRNNTAENKMVYPALFVLLLAFVPIFFVGCKKKEESQQQAAESRETKQVSDSQRFDTSEKIGLRILYAGLLNTERAKDFVYFLKTYFQLVETTNYNTFTGSYTTDFDVAIIDYNGVGYNVPPPKISRQYSRATVTVGVPGACLCSGFSLKTGYL
jgi:hypothetical protein